jgi:hypothetical protein
MVAALAQRSALKARAALEKDIRTAATFIHSRGVLFKAPANTARARAPESAT